MRINYFEFDGFENVYLEDSYVLEIIEQPNELKFGMEIVLISLHQMYSKPKPNEMYCYKKAEILFSNIKRIDWIEKTLIPYTDASGEIDFGNIDVFYLDEEFYHLYGDWGEVKIQSAKPQIKYL